MSSRDRDEKRICPEGKFPGQPVDFGFGRSENGNLYVKVRFEINIQADGESEKYFVNYDGYFTDKTWERTEESLKFCGWDGKSQMPDLEGFGSKVPMLEIEHETYTGQEGPVTFASVKWVNSAGGVRIKEENKATADDFRQLNAMLGLARPSGNRPPSQGGNRQAPRDDSRGRGSDNRRDNYDRSNRPQQGGNRAPEQHRDSNRPPPGRTRYEDDGRGNMQEQRGGRQKGDPEYDEFDHRADTFRGGRYADEDDSNKPPF